MLLAETVYVMAILFEYLNAHGLMKKAAKQGMLDVNNPLQKLAYKHQLLATGVSYLMTALLGMVAIWVSYWVSTTMASNGLLSYMALIGTLMITFVIRNVFASQVVTLLNKHFKESLAVKRESTMPEAQKYAQDKLKSGELSASQLDDLINHMKGE